MSGMAEVLAAHQRDHGKRTLHQHCSCGWFGQVLGGDFTTHQVAMPTAAGFGPVKEAAPPEVRYVDTISEKNVLDEVVARDAYVHLEAMDDNHWWLLVTAGGAPRSAGTPR